MNDSLYTTGQVANICKVAPKTVAGWFNAGELKGFRLPLSQDRRVSVKDLCDFMRRSGFPDDMIPDAAGRLRVAVAGAMAPDRAAFDRLDAAFHETIIEAALSFADRRPHCVAIDLGLGRIDASVAARSIRDRGVVVVGLSRIPVDSGDFDAILSPDASSADMRDAIESLVESRQGDRQAATRAVTVKARRAS